MSPRTKTPPPNIQLSQELIEEIIDALFYSEETWKWDILRRDLASCSLVSRSFLPRSQAHLFSRISILSQFSGGRSEHNLPEAQRNDQKRARVAALSSIIDNRPEIADYIRSINLSISSGDCSWMYSEPTIKVMDKISINPIKEFEFRGETSLCSIDEPMQLIDRFFRPYIFPHVTSLHLSCLGTIPQQLVSGCSRLQDLTMTLVSFDSFLDTHDAQIPKIRPRIKALKYLSLEICDSTHIDYSDLRQLTILEDFGRNLITEQAIINSSQGKLEELLVERSSIELTLSCGGAPASTFMNLKNQPNLSTLHLVAYFDPVKKEHLHPISEICRTLQTVTLSDNRPATPKFTISILVQHSHSAEILLDEDWDALASEILRISAGKSMVLTLFMVYCSPDFEPNPRDLDFQRLFFSCEESLETVINERLSSLKANQNIVVNQSFKIYKCRPDDE